MCSDPVNIHVYIFIWLTYGTLYSSGPQPFLCGSPLLWQVHRNPPPPNKLPIQINIPYNLNNIYVVIRHNNSVKLYDDFKEQRKIMGFSEMVVPASYAPILCIVFESCPFPPRDGQIPPGGGGIPPRLGTTALQDNGSSSGLNTTLLPLHWQIAHRSVYCTTL